MNCVINLKLFVYICFSTHTFELCFEGIVLRRPLSFKDLRTN